MRTLALDVGTRALGGSVVTLTGTRAADSFDLAQAYDAHARELFGFALNALRDHGAAEECVQDVFVRAWRARERFDSARASARTWLFAIMRNVVRDRFRARQREPRRVGPEGLDQVPERATDPTDWLALAEALSRLSPEHRHAVVGIHLVGVPYTELAEAAGVPVATMRTRTYYGLRALRDHFDEGKGQS